MSLIWLAKSDTGWNMKLYGCCSRFKVTTAASLDGLSTKHAATNQHKGYEKGGSRYKDFIVNNRRVMFAQPKIVLASSVI